jgi:hypothetical protein
MRLSLFEVLGAVWKQLNTESVYSIDSFPIAVCDNIRICRSKLYDGAESYRGYQASQKRYFYGVIETSGSLRSQLLPKSIHAVTAQGFELKVMLFVLALSVNLWVAT